jgi:hypothetical protein
MGVVLSKRIRAFAIAAVLLGGATGACMIAPHAHWLELNNSAGGKDARKAEEARNHKFVEFETFYMPILDDNSQGRVFAFSVSIEVPDSRRVNLVETAKPRLTDAFIHDMYGLWNKDAAYRNGVVHVDVIRDRLSRSSCRILGDENVNDVSLKAVDEGEMQDSGKSRSGTPASGKKLITAME